jgi:MFS family permease
MGALRDPRYRLVLASSTLSGISLWLCNIAVLSGLLGSGRGVLEIGSFQAAWTLGVPMAVILSGILVDRLGPTPVVVAGLIMEAASVALMGLVFLAGQPDLLVLLAVALAVGCADGLCGVAFNVLAGGVVARPLMASAIGLLLISVAAGRIVGGTAAGPLVDALGTPVALLAAAGLVIVGVGLAAAVGPVRLAEPGVAASYLDIRPALGWYRSQGEAITTLALGATMALLVYGYFSLLPVVVGQTLGTDARAQGLAMALGGVGVAVAAVCMGPVARRLGSGRLLLAAVVGSGLGVVGLALSATALAVGLVAVLLPIFTNVHGATSNLILQGLAPTGIRGRVVGLYALAFAMLLPVGTFMAGWVGQRAGVRETLAAIGLTMMGVGIGLVAARPALLRLGRGQAEKPGASGSDEVVVVSIEPGSR